MECVDSISAERNSTGLVCCRGNRKLVDKYPAIIRSACPLIVFAGRVPGDVHNAMRNETPICGLHTGRTPFPPSLSLSFCRVSKPKHRANEDRRVLLMHASSNYVYARVRDSINAGQRVQRAFRSRLLLRSVIGPRIGKHTVALIRTFPSLTYLPFAFIEHIFRIVCLANLICDQPDLSVTLAISLLRFPRCNP